MSRSLSARDVGEGARERAVEAVDDPLGESRAVEARRRALGRAVADEHHPARSVHRAVLGVAEPGQRRADAPPRRARPPRRSRVGGAGCSRSQSTAGSASRMMRSSGAVRRRLEPGREHHPALEGPAEQGDLERRALAQGGESRVAAGIVLQEDLRLDERAVRAACA